MRSVRTLVTWLDAGVPGHWAKRYGIAVLATGVTLAIGITLSGIASHSPVVLFTAAVAIAARYGGRGPAIFASLLSAPAIEVALFLSASPGEPAETQPMLRLTVFVFVASIIGSMSSALHEAQRTAERDADRLARLNAELEQHMEEVQTLSEQLQETNESLVAERDRAEALAKRAQAAAQAREDVLAVVAHDLRNPLSVVSTTTQLFLEMEPAPERRARLLHGLQRAVRQMNRLITDLLEIVRLESGRLPLQLRALDARDVLMQAREMFEHAAAETGVALEVRTMEEALPVCVDTDRMLQVLGNLAGNALKATGRGGRVTLGVVRTGRRTVFSVADTGPGIPQDKLDRLFDRFWQARANDLRGVGLGLTIARGIVEAHGGRIWVESRLGEGSTFFVALPVVPSGGAARAQSAVAVAVTP